MFKLKQIDTLKFYADDDVLFPPDRDPVWASSLGSVVIETGP